jgi:type III restriction enzyme
VRYFPFDYNEHEKSKRKFDNEPRNPLRVLEEFYYHSDDDVRYLDELKRELKNKGFIKDNRVIKKFALKDDFKQSGFFKEIKVWKNERVDNPEKRKRTLAELEKEFVFEYKTSEFALKEQQVVLDKDTDEILAESLKKDSKTISKKFADFEKHIVAKAINKKAKKDLSLLRFDKLQNELNINSVDDIFTEKFIGNFKINIVTSKDKNDLNDISNEEKLDLLLNFFEAFTQKLREIANPHKGTEKFEAFSFDDLFGEEKEKSVLIDQESKNLETELLQHSWYVLNGFNGTSEERELLEFVKKKIGNLKEKYDEVYLLRNEEVYKIYDFEKGRGFEPDFLLFLKGDKKNLYYQIFIEPKGGQFADKEGGFKESKEGWKEDFLQQITDKYGNGALLKAENKDYKLIGLPLFNKKTENDFEKVFSGQLLD